MKTTQDLGEIWISKFSTLKQFHKIQLKKVPSTELCSQTMKIQRQNENSKNTKSVKSHINKSILAYLRISKQKIIGHKRMRCYI